MKRIWWKTRLVFWLTYYNYGTLYYLVKTWKWTSENEWMENYPEISPKQTVLEDLSYA